MYVCMNVRMHVCIIHACMDTCMYVCLYVWIYACLYVRMCVCLYVCMHVGARCSSVVRVFFNGAMGRRIDPSWSGPI